MKRKQGRKEERKKAINRKYKKMEEDGRRNKEPLKAGEKHEMTRKVVEYNGDDVLVKICKFLDELSEDRLWETIPHIEAKENTSEIDLFVHLIQPNPTSRRRDLGSLAMAGGSGKRLLFSSSLFTADVINQ